MSTMIPDLVVGEVGFGPNFGAYNELALEERVRELSKRNNRLRRVLERCAALSEDVANDKHEALLEASQPL
jgi:hypothetical protein